ncbi:hypothetical protein Y032_0002g711 [Ancylostoma ceylanicum]|uniref:Uncharacterized protein n=1 Tax=Ancylostoma ceylanicum TaxID=53326 RepID=A0A016W2S4_9BILA|nr:hypothetical protein Y032_0002g711 [Ancylostoma ceylanicum]
MSLVVQKTKYAQSATGSRFGRHAIPREKWSESAVRSCVAVENECAWNDHGSFCDVCKLNRVATKSPSLLVCLGLLSVIGSQSTQKPEAYLQRRDLVAATEFCTSDSVAATGSRARAQFIL